MIIKSSIPISEKCRFCGKTAISSCDKQSELTFNKHHPQGVLVGNAHLRISSCLQNIMDISYKAVIEHGIFQLDNACVISQDIPNKARDCLFYGKAL